MINRYEQEYYRNIGRIADALEKLVHVQNSTKVIGEYKYKEKVDTN